MHKCFKLFLTLSLLLNFNIILAPKAHAVEDAIIAVVNDEVITLRDLREYIRSTYVGLVAEGHSEERIKEIMLDLELNGLNKLIEDKLLLSEANAIGLEIKEKIIEEQMAEVKAKYGSEEKFMEALIQHGATITDLRNKIVNQLKIKYVINYAVRSKIYINPKEVTTFYEENLDQFRTNEYLVLESIFIPYDPDKASAMNKAKEALDKIHSGQPFKEVSEEYSASPSIGQVERGQLMPAIENKIFALSEMEVTDLIEIDTGIYIFKLIEKAPSDIADITDVKSRIENVLFNQKFRTKFVKWLDELKENAYIEIKE